jgi:hemolysin III
MIAVYAASTLSHVVLEPKRRRFFRSLDQGVIFLFIAGNFTPVALSLLTGDPWRWLLPLMWFGALAGFCSKVLWKHRVESTAVTHYLAMGWLPITAAQPLVQSLPEGGLFWCVAGGVCYTAGTIFLVCDGKVPYFHAVWHLLVIAGSSCHFVAVVKYILPA